MSKLGRNPRESFVNSGHIWSVWPNTQTLWANSICRCAPRVYPRAAARHKPLRRQRSRSMASTHGPLRGEMTPGAAERAQEAIRCMQHDCNGVRAWPEHRASSGKLQTIRASIPSVRPSIESPWTPPFENTSTGTLRVIKRSGKEGTMGLARPGAPHFSGCSKIGEHTVRAPTPRKVRDLGMCGCSG